MRRVVTRITLSALALLLCCSDPVVVGQTAAVARPRLIVPPQPLCDTLIRSGFHDFVTKGTPSYARQSDGKYECSAIRTVGGVDYWVTVSGSADDLSGFSLEARYRRGVSGVSENVASLISTLFASVPGAALTGEMRACIASKCISDWLSAPMVYAHFFVTPEFTGDFETYTAYIQLICGSASHPCDR